MIKNKKSNKIHTFAPFILSLTPTKEGKKILQQSR